jgi:hypothetical protein
MKIIAQERFLVAPESASDVYHPATVLAGRFVIVMALRLRFNIFAIS